MKKFFGKNELLEASKDRVNLNEQVKQLQIQTKLCEQGFQFVSEMLFEPITKTVTDTREKFLRRVN